MCECAITQGYIFHVSPHVFAESVKWHWSSQYESSHVFSLENSVKTQVDKVKVEEGEENKNKSKARDSSGRQGKWETIN